MSIATFFRLGYIVLKNATYLFFINVLLTFIEIDKVVKCLQFRGVHIGLKLSLPTPIPTLWDFVEPPGKALPTLFASISLVGNIVMDILLMFVLVIISALLSYLYLKKIYNTMGVEPRSRLNSAIQIMLFELLIIAYILVIIGLAFVTPPIAAIAILMFIPIYYFIYATPYVIVLEGVNIVEALRRSITIATSSKYFIFTLVYALIVLLLSPMMSFLAVDLKVFGIAIASIVTGLVGLWLSASTAAMVLHIVEKM